MSTSKVFIVHSTQGTVTGDKENSIIRGAPEFPASISLFVSLYIPSKYTERKSGGITNAVQSWFSSVLES